MTEQSVSDKLRDLADTLYDRIEDLQDAMAAGLRDAAMEAEAPASERHKIIPGDVVWCGAGEGTVRPAPHLVVFDDGTSLCNLLLLCEDGRGHFNEGFPSSWWKDAADCKFIGHVDVDLAQFKAPAGEEAPEDSANTSEPHEFVPGDVVNVRGESFTRGTVLWRDPDDCRMLLVHRPDGLGHAGPSRLPEGLASKSGWWCFPEDLTFVRHSDADMSDFWEDGKVPGDESHEFAVGDLVRIESEPDGLPVGNYMIVFNDEECDNRRVPSLLIRRGDGLGHHTRGFNDVWWVRGSDCAFIAHTGINPRDFKREPVVNPERRFRAGDLVRVGLHAPGDLPAGNYVVVHDDGTDWMPFVIYRGDGEGCTCARFRDAYWACSHELTLIAHTEINPEDFKKKAA